MLKILSIIIFQITPMKLKRSRNIQVIALVELPFLICDCNNRLVALLIWFLAVWAGNSIFGLLAFCIVELPLFFQENFF